MVPFLRGMDGEGKPGGPDTVKDSVGTTYTDHDELPGFQIEIHRPG